MPRWPGYPGQRLAGCRRCCKPDSSLAGASFRQSNSRTQSAICNLQSAITWIYRVIMTQPHARYRVGVDIGGTFTDLIVVDDESGAFAVGKTLTTPHDPSQAIETVLLETLRQAGVALQEVRHLVHGTTLVANALIERKGARTA